MPKIVNEFYMEIKRDYYLQELIDRMHNGLIKVVTGIRRSGKSYLLFNIFREYLLSQKVDKNHIIAITLDSYENKEYRKPQILLPYIKSLIIDNADYYIFLDEVQMLEDFEEVLNSLMRIKNVDINVTGSNSKFLSSDVATEFRGRGEIVHVNPLTFSEYYSAFDNIDKYTAWEEYSRYGGMPMLLTKNTDEDKTQYLEDLFKRTYIRDIVDRHNLRGDIVLDTLVDILASSVGSLNNPNKIAKTFASNKIKASDKTVSLYIDYLIDSFLIRKAQRYDIKGRKYIDSPFKYYFSDIGLRNVRLNLRQQEQTHIMENILFNELIVRGYSVDVGIVEIHTRTEDGKQEKKQLEVDFVCNKGNMRYYIQSAFSMPNKGKLEQEQASLDGIDDSFKKIIITQDIAKPWRNEKGYLIINIIDFLLNPNSLDL